MSLSLKLPRESKADKTKRLEEKSRKMIQV